MSPTRPLSPCSTPGCPGRATHHGKCARHDAERRRSSWQTTDARRPSAAQRGYGSYWQALRARFLRAHPTCVACGQPATDVDHIIALRKGGQHEWSNLQSLCRLHHNRKTNAVDGGGWRRAGAG